MIALSATFRKALDESSPCLQARSQAERVGIFTTALRRAWPSRYLPGRYKRHLPDDPQKIFHLVTDPRFWVDVCVVKRPGDHPMINAAAEKALSLFDEEEPENVLKSLGAMLTALNLTVQETEQLAAEAAVLLNASKRSMRET